MRNGCCSMHSSIALSPRGASLTPSSAEKGLRLNVFEFAALNVLLSAVCNGNENKSWNRIATWGSGHSHTVCFLIFLQPVKNLFCHTFSLEETLLSLIFKTTGVQGRFASGRRTVYKVVLYLL